MTTWRLDRGRSGKAIAFVRGSKADAIAAAKRLAPRFGSVAVIPNPTRLPRVGEVWRGLRGDRCRILKADGSQVTVLQLDTGHRVTSDLADFLATYRPPAARLNGPKRKGRNNPSRSKAARGRRASQRRAAGSSRVARSLARDIRDARAGGATSISARTRYLTKQRAVRRPNPKRRKGGKVRADALAVGDIVMPPERELRLWMRRDAAERGLTDKDLGIMLTEVREGAPDTRGRWILFSGYLPDHWYKSGRPYKWTFKARPETAWVRVAQPVQQNPPRASRKVRRAAASGRFVKARHYAASGITRGVRRLDHQRRAAFGLGRKVANPRGRKLGGRNDAQGNAGRRGQGTVRAGGASRPRDAAGRYVGHGMVAARRHRGAGAARAGASRARLGSNPKGRNGWVLTRIAEGYGRVFISTRRTHDGRAEEMFTTEPAEAMVWRTKREADAAARRAKGVWAFGWKWSVAPAGVQSNRPNRRQKRRNNPLPRWVDQRSARTVGRGPSRLMIGCPKGKWSPTRRRCRVGTKAVEVRRMASRNPRDKELARARRTFRRLNEIEPERLTRVRGAKNAPKVAVKLGELVSFRYRSDKYAGGPDNPDGKTLLYEHTTRRPRPVLATDPGGKEVHIVGGRMHPTPDGLVN
jgi:hypothetical protein